MARYCNICNGILEETDNIGTEECNRCGTIYRLLPMEREDESTE